MVRTPKFVRLPEERPQSLLDAAIEVFSTVGYRAARLEQVGEAAGVTKGTIYYYFDDKEDLLTQAVTARVAATYSGIAGVVDAVEGGTPEKLRAVLRAAWSRWTHPDTAKMLRLVTGEVRVEFPALFEKAMRTGPLQLMQLVARLLEEGQRRREIAADVDVPAAAQFIIVSMMQQAVFSLDLPERTLRLVEPDRLFEAGIGTILSGVLVRDRAATSGSGKRRPTAAKRRR